jgi:hypothetical protein
MISIGIPKYTGILWESSIKCILNHPSFGIVLNEYAYAGLLRIKKSNLMSQKTIRIIAWTLMILPSLMLSMSGFMKVSGSQEIVDSMTMGGFGNYVLLLGIVELVSVVLFLYPKTYKIGFLLLCCYLGGAFAVELGSGQPPVAAILLVVLWIAVFLRNRYVFIPEEAGN